jgi:hypothetical protein
VSNASFVKTFKPQFAPLVERGEKLQTVRPVPKRMPKPKDRISLPPGQFAVADGFSCWEEMRQWFEHQHGLPFTGILIRWKLDAVTTPE